jgi:hypothetical protein
MKTVSDLQNKIITAPAHKVKACLIAIAKVWLTNPREKITSQTLLDTETPLDSESLAEVTRLLSEYGFWPEHK